jgi:hypothetical protein
MAESSPAGVLNSTVTPSLNKQSHYDAFIGYRDKTGLNEAIAIHLLLTNRGLDVYIDKRDLPVVPYKEELLLRIAEARNFIIVLSPNSLDRCADAEDMLRLEIEQALQTGRKVIPVMMSGFEFPKFDPPISSLSKLSKLSCVTWDTSAIDRISKNLEVPWTRTIKQRVRKHPIVGLVVLFLLAAASSLSPYSPYLDRHPVGAPTPVVLTSKSKEVSAHPPTPEPPSVKHPSDPTGSAEVSQSGDEKRKASSVDTALAETQKIHRSSRSNAARNYQEAIKNNQPVPASEPPAVAPPPLNNIPAVNDNLVQMTAVDRPSELPLSTPLPAQPPAMEPNTTSANPPISEPPQPICPANASALAPPVTQVGEDADRQAICVLIQQLSSALLHRNIAELQDIWPKMGSNKNKFKGLFESGQALSRELYVTSQTVNPDGLIATVVGNYAGSLRDLRGVQSPRSGNFYVRFTKKNGKWFIDDASF